MRLNNLKSTTKSSCGPVRAGCDQRRYVIDLIAGRLRVGVCGPVRAGPAKLLIMLAGRCGLVAGWCAPPFQGGWGLGPHPIPEGGK